MRTKAVLYDMDGVLVDSIEAWYEILRAACERFGREPIERSRFEASFGQGIAADVETFFPGRTIGEIDTFYHEEFPARIGAVRLVDGALETLEAIARKGHGQAVVTNTPRPLAERVLARTGLADRIDFLAASGDGPEKPDPALVRIALDALGVSPDEALYIGDSNTDRAAAAAAGVPFVGFGIDAARTIESLREIPGLIEEAVRPYAAS